MVLGNFIHESVKVFHGADGLLQDLSGYNTGKQSKRSTLRLALSIWACVWLVHQPCRQDNVMTHVANRLLKSSIPNPPPPLCLPLPPSLPPVSPISFSPHPLLLIPFFLCLLANEYILQYHKVTIQNVTKLLFSDTYFNVY